MTPTDTRAPARPRAAAALTAVLLAAGLGAPARAGEADDRMYGRALDWLVARQHPNGGFGQVPGQAPGEIGITGLVLKGLADAPEPWRAKVRPAADKAAAFLLQHQKPDGSFAQGDVGLTNYRTSIAIMALGALDRARYRDAINRAVSWLLGSQFDAEQEKIGPDSPHHGGFGYGHGDTPKPDADLSNTFLALAALKDAGIGPDDPVFKRAITFLERCQNSSETNPGVGGLKPLDDGGFMYDPGLDRNKSAVLEHADGTRSVVSYASMTYAGLMSMLHVGVTKDDRRVQAALGWIRANYTLEENAGLGVRQTSPQAAQQGLFYYYHTFAKTLAALGSPTVDTKDGPRPWARDLCDALAARQAEDGSFKNPHDRWWEADPVLVTAYVVNALNYARPFLGQGE